MADKINLSTRWKNLEPTKKFVFWACVASAVLTIFVGFNWGGWVTGGTARDMAENAAASARTELAVSSCVERFTKGEQAATRLAKLKKVESWERGSYMEKSGWVTLAGTKEPIPAAGERCAELLLNP